MALSSRRLITSFVAALGAVGAYLTIFSVAAPRVDVQPLYGLRARDALSTEFAVTNHGMFDIRNVHIGVKFNNFHVTYLSPGQYGFTPRDPNDPGELRVGDVTTIIPSNSLYDRIKPMRSGRIKIPFSLPEEDEVDIDITVSYRPAWYPFRFFGRDESFRFITKVAEDGRIYWLPHPSPIGSQER